MLDHQQNCSLCGHRVPLYFWFVLSGALCDILQALIDYTISTIYLFEWERTTVCWTLSYILSIMIRHSSHRFLVFGEYEGSYCSSLMRTYATYSSSIVVSMVTNHFIVSSLGVRASQAWVATMLWTGLYNYFLLKASWKRSKEAKEKLVKDPEQDGLLPTEDDSSSPMDHRRHHSVSVDHHHQQHHHYDDEPKKTYFPFQDFQADHTTSSNGNGNGESSPAFNV